MGEAWSVEGQPGVLRGSLEASHSIGMVGDEKGLAGRGATLAAGSVLSLAGKAIGLRREAEVESATQRQSMHPSALPISHWPGPTWARLMYSSWAAFRFSFFPPQVFRAEACRARPNEKVRAHGFSRGHLLMALRLMDASSSLWPPDKKVTPGE